MAITACVVVYIVSVSGHLKNIGSYSRPITDTKRNNALHYAECYVLFIVMVSVIMLNAVMLSVLGPKKHCQ